MKKDYKKSMNQKARAKSRSKKILLAGTSIAAGVMLGITPISMLRHYLLLVLNKYMQM